ncbi:HNH endonuclease [Desmospora activa]|uniref:HNH endonuclease n=1 Tax=Desmospora activa DSM 45169 TaxID=1121389 RepID=A0A2T4Z7Z1_9BACL|nr:HNH endonuclease [Desmospora activa]PTM58004.1 HNH endonuclease [Desmospora activa DSM 45169]
MGWAEKVKENFNRSCIVCGEKNWSLQAHHLYARHSFPEIKKDTLNGVALCVKCHKRYHRDFGRGKNTGEEFIKWIEYLKDRGEFNITDQKITTLYDQVQKIKQKIKPNYKQRYWQGDSTNKMQTRIHNGFIEEKIEESAKKLNLHLEVKDKSEKEKEKLRAELTDRISLKDIANDYDGFVKVETNLTRAEFDFFKKYCDKLGLTVTFAMYLLIRNEMDAKIAKD